MASPFVIAAPQAADALAVLIVKAAYYARAACVASAITPTVSAPYSNMAPQAGDPIQTAAVKLAYWLSGLSGSGGTGGGFASGAGAPVANPANTAVSSAYWDTTNHNLYVWDPVAQGWFAH